MHVYLVRHGETELNRRKIHQSPNTPLSNKGRNDVRTVAEFLRSVNSDMLLTSEYTRARETAGIIGLSIGLTPEVQGLFYEIVRPSNLFGKSLFHPLTLWFVFCSLWNWKDKTWRYKDAENILDIRNRAEKAKSYLESLAQEHSSVIVISHTVFINVLLLRMFRNTKISYWDLLVTLYRIRKLRNTGVTHLEYVSAVSGGERGWKLIA